MTCKLLFEFKYTNSLQKLIDTIYLYTTSNVAKTQFNPEKHLAIT